MNESVNKLPIDDEVLGHLVYNEGFNWYESDLYKDGLPLAVKIEAGEDGNVSTAFERAKLIFSNFDHYAEAAKTHAVDQLLTLKNDSWLDEDEDPVNPNRFKARMTLEELFFSRDGDVIFYHDDGDLFWGHAIEIGMNGADVFDHADIPG
jgi:hypothetical protein